ncbi:hypothetical protein SKAU_G00341310 [Synaphobranchus kaupii]|uniref:Uncharacterized protein n=1 Tax=Synaphobranchus kaupii TaxID=118154 RepID=A0A9Q1EN07_SYNKA|nr:hypothetical protein SKAU_G00341310 [Synaphobranchus kaupii]
MLVLLQQEPLPESDVVKFTPAASPIRENRRWSSLSYRKGPAVRPNTDNSSQWWLTFCAIQVGPSGYVWTWTMITVFVNDFTD